MPFTMEDFERQFIKKRFPRLSPEDKEELLKSMPPEERLAGLPLEERLTGLTDEQIQQYLARRSTDVPSRPRKPRKKK